MDKELFDKTESMLYRYFNSKKKIVAINNEISNLIYRRDKVEYDIKHANVAIDYYQNGIGIQERVQSSPSGSSYAENQMCKEIEKLEREHLQLNKIILRRKAKIREMEAFINHMDNNISQLNEEDKRFLELKYGDGKNPIQISMILNIAQATAYRKRDELVEIVAEYENTLFNFDKKVIKS